MAVDSDSSPTLTLELAPDKVSYREFGNLVHAFMGLLQDISEEACGNRKAVHWEISVSEGSLHIDADLPSETDASTANRVLNAVNRPSRQIQHALDKFPRRVPGTRILIGEDRRNILHETPEEPVTHDSYVEYGTVEGILDTLSARGRLHFTISEPIWNMAVRCTVPEKFVDRMHEMWRQRVAAHGMVSLDANGRPTSIKAEEVELFPYDETPIEAFRGLLSTD